MRAAWLWLYSFIDNRRVAQHKENNRNVQKLDSNKPTGANSQIYPCEANFNGWSVVMGTDDVQPGGREEVQVCGSVVDSSPAMACGSAEYSWTSKTPQSRDAFSFLSLEAEGAILNKPWETEMKPRSLNSNSRRITQAEFIMCCKCPIL